MPHTITVDRRIHARPPRDRHDPVIYYGLIASGNQVIKHGGTRDKLGQELGILCFETEAAGLMDNFSVPRDSWDM
jgi:nucleoside phosphorylase